MNYIELLNECKELFGDDCGHIMLREDYNNIQKIKSYEYETKKKIRIIIDDYPDNKHLNFKNCYLGSPQLKEIRQKYNCSISWLGCNDYIAVLYNYEK